MKSSIRLREPHIEDMKEVNSAHIRSIKELCQKDYRKDQIEGWAAIEYSWEHWKNSIANDFYRVIEKEGQIEGFLHAKIHDDKVTGEILGLYFTPELAGRGIGRVAFDSALSFFKENNVTKILVSATRTAVGFYEKMGFEKTSNELIYETRGTGFEYLTMEMILSLDY